VYTSSHAPLVERWFLPTLPDEFDARLHRHEQIGEEHRYGSAEFNRATLLKVDAIAAACERLDGEAFVFSDVDIQFFRPLREELLAVLGDLDVAFQRNALDGEINSGFLICRSGPRSLAFWREVRRLMLADPARHDQDAVNLLLQPGLWHVGRAALRRVPRLSPLVRGLSSPYRTLRWTWLPDTYFCPGLRSFQAWTEASALELPPGIALHHANFCVGVEAKMRQLAAVAAQVAAGPE
jgi:hypothetical protein